MPAFKMSSLLLGHVHLDLDALIRAYHSDSQDLGLLDVRKTAEIIDNCRAATDHILQHTTAIMMLYEWIKKNKKDAGDLVEEVKQLESVIQNTLFVWASGPISKTEAQLITMFLIQRLTEKVKLNKCG